MSIIKVTKMFKLLHSSVSYLVVLLVIFTLVNAIVKIKSNDSYKANDNRFALLTTVFAVLQFILGFGSFYFSNYYQTLREVGMKLVMKDSTLRMFNVEHPLMMMIAIALIIIGFYKHQQKTDAMAKFKTLAWFYGVALLFILSRVPWEQWFKS